MQEFVNHLARRGRGPRGQGEHRAGCGAGGRHLHSAPLPPPRPEAGRRLPAVHGRDRGPPDALLPDAGRRGHGGQDLQPGGRPGPARDRGTADRQPSRRLPDVCPERSLRVAAGGGSRGHRPQRLGGCGVRRSRRRSTARIRSSISITTSACSAASACGPASRSRGSMPWTSTSAASTRGSARSATGPSSNRAASRAASAWSAARSGRWRRRTTCQPSREVKTVCPYCGVGCSIYLGVRGGKIVGARGDRESPANRGSLCVKGRFGHEFVNHPERLTTPLIKKDGRVRRGHVGRGTGPGGREIRPVPRRAVRRAGLGQVHQRGELSHPEVRPGGDGHQQHRPLRPALPRADRGRAGAEPRQRGDDQLDRRDRRRRLHACHRHQHHGRPPGARPCRSSGPCGAGRS